MDDLTLEITKKCPMSCILCSSDGGEPYLNEFSLSELKDIVDQAKSLGVTQISLSGGEPLTYPYILDVCKYISDLDIDVFVYTSGNIIDENNSISSISESFFLKLKNAGIKEIVFSMHGSTPQIHDKVTRTKGSFANLLESIKNSQTVGLSSEVHFVPIRENYRDLPYVVSLIENVNLRSLHILRFVAQGRGYKYRDQLELLPAELSELYTILNELMHVSSINIVIGAHYNELGLGNSKCKAGVGKAVIRPDGFVFPCVGMKRVEQFMNCNDIRSNSLEYIISESYAFRLLRQLFAKNEVKVLQQDVTAYDFKDYCIAQNLSKFQLDNKRPEQ